jgi:hypothetical protein
MGYNRPADFSFFFEEPRECVTDVSQRSTAPGQTVPSPALPHSGVLTVLLTNLPLTLVVPGGHGLLRPSGSWAQRQRLWGSLGKRSTGPTTSTRRCGLGDNLYVKSTLALGTVCRRP